MFPAGQSASQKLRVFVSEPMGNKDVFQLSGIDKILGQRLVAAGFTHVSKPSWPGTFAFALFVLVKALLAAGYTQATHTRTLLVYNHL